MTTGLVAEFPGEDGGGALVAVHDELDVVLVKLLSGGVGVEGCSVTASDVTVSIDAAKVVPIIEHCHDELDVILFCHRDDGVEAGDSICSGVVDASIRWSGGGVEQLEVDGLVCGHVDVAESPGSDNLQST